MSRNSLLEAGAKSGGEVTVSVRLRTKWFWVRVQLQSLNKLILQIACLSNHLTSLRKLALIHKSSTQIPKALNLHEIAEKAKKYFSMNALI